MWTQTLDQNQRPHSCTTIRQTKNGGEGQKGQKGQGIYMHESRNESIYDNN